MEIGWKIASSVAGLAAGFAANKALAIGWRKAVGHEPPIADDDPSLSLKEALLFAVISGALIALLRVLAMRGARKVYYRVPKEARF